MDETLAFDRSNFDPSKLVTPIEITVERVRELRDKTGYGMMMCKKALQEASGDESLAVTILERQRFWLV